MLFLSRRIGEKIQIGGGITLTLMSVSRSRASIGIEAPRDVRILRQELTQNTASGRPVSVKSMKGPAEKSGTN